MSGRVARRALLLALLVASAARGGEAPCSECRYRGDLDALFVPARALGAGWEILLETPEDPQADPDLRAAGVRSTATRHYTKALPAGAGAEVCTVEIWACAGPEAARRTSAGMQRTGWRFGVHGNLLVMLHGVALRGGGPLRPALLPACVRLADLMDAHAEERLRGARGD